MNEPAHLYTPFVLLSDVYHQSKQDNNLSSLCGITMGITHALDDGFIIQVRVYSTDSTGSELQQFVGDEGGKYIKAYSEECHILTRSITSSKEFCKDLWSIGMTVGLRYGLFKHYINRMKLCGYNDINDFAGMTHVEKTTEYDIKDRYG